MWFLYNI